MTRTERLEMERERAARRLRACVLVAMFTALFLAWMMATARADERNLRAVGSVTPEQVQAAARAHWEAGR